MKFEIAVTRLACHMAGS